jgi:O-acetyl-ADP-ribose deacetylase (regulator of RNase III)
MKVKINQTTIEIVKSNIVYEKVDAIVNAANPSLAPGGGVSGAIHKEAGEELWEECKKLGTCKRGEAKITKGYKLKAKYVIHTVGPIYKGKKMDAIILSNCYINSLQLAKKKGITTISFPAISTGIYGYPLEEAAKISIQTVIKWLRKNTGIKVVRFVLFRDKEYNIYLNTLKNAC